MPLMVDIEIVPDAVKQGLLTKAQYDAAQKKINVDMVTAMENVASGVYRLVTTEPEAPAVPGPVRLEDMSVEDLKLLMLQSGVTPTGKTMKRDDIIALIRKKLDAVTIVEDGADG